MLIELGWTRNFACQLFLQSVHIIQLNRKLAKYLNNYLTYSVLLFKALKFFLEGLGQPSEKHMLHINPFHLIFIPKSMERGRGVDCYNPLHAGFLKFKNKKIFYCQIFYSFFILMQKLQLFNFVNCKHWMLHNFNFLHLILKNKNLGKKTWKFPVLIA